MGLLNNFARRNHPDWCRKCKREMERADSRLFAVPSMSVGHYVEHTDPEFYEDSLHMVDSREDIPAGMYACGAVQYRCPGCGRRVTVLSPYLPVRDREKREAAIVFRNGELDDFLWR